MKSEQSFSFRLGMLLVMSGFCATLLGCVNKAQQNFQRPPAPVVVSTAVSQERLQLYGRPWQDRRA